MKVDRMLTILMLLLIREPITAVEFAQIFNTALRTIHRDIDEIKKAGIMLTAEQGIYGGVRFDKAFKKAHGITTPSDDIISTIFMLIEEFPKLLDNRTYVMARFRDELSEREHKKTGEAEQTDSAKIKVTVRFAGQYKKEIEKYYNLDIVSEEFGECYACIYIEENEKKYERLLLLADKCECIAPPAVRDYIRGKVEAFTKIYKIYAEQR